MDRNLTFQRIQQSLVSFLSYIAVNIMAINVAISTCCCNNDLVPLYFVNHIWIQLQSGLFYAIRRVDVCWCCWCQAAVQAGSGSEDVEVVCLTPMCSSRLQRGQTARMKANLTYHFHLACQWVAAVCRGFIQPCHWIRTVFTAEETWQRRIVNSVFLSALNWDSNIWSSHRTICQ